MQCLEKLYAILEDLREQGDDLNERLADYVFFPLSHVFRDSKTLPARAVEIAVQCLQILVSYGWRDRINHGLGKQLLILLVFLAGGTAAETKGRDVNEELSTSAFECLAAFFEVLGLPSSSTKNFTDIEDIPMLGHAVTVTLDRILEGPSSKVQMAALRALHGLLFVVLDKQARISFFPGVVSCLTKVLQPSSQSRSSYKVFEASLIELRLLILDVLEDDNARHCESVNLTPLGTARDKYMRPNEAHLRAWSAQVKLALANVARLRHHSRPEVRNALFQLCLSVLEDCRESLPESATMAVETLVIISSTAAENDREVEATMRTITTTDAGMVDILKSSIHNWIIALPRIIQSNDDTAKGRIIRQISTSVKLIEDLCINSDVLQDALSSNLLTSIASLIQKSSSRGIYQLHAATTSHMPMPGGITSPSVVFLPVLMDGHEDVLHKLGPVVERLRASPSSSAVARKMTDFVRNSSGYEKVAGLWLLLRLLDDQSSSDFSTERFLHLGTKAHDSELESLEHVYLISLEILAQSADGAAPDWRLQALALEGVALQARRQRVDFRAELVDALYPVVERMGSGQPALQSHAVTCLNTLSIACGYNSSSELIIANVDYLVNAVALKLNTFDISPQAPSVLLMMIKLCGPSLIPYLDDLVESIFAALASFHGYSRLVESLFSVLGTIVDEGRKTAAPMLLGEAAVSDRRKRYSPITMTDLALALRSPKSPGLNDDDHTESSPVAADTGDSPTAAAHKREWPTQNDTPDTFPAQPPPSKTYTVVKAIARLGQHYLTHDSPMLRRQLLQLTATACTTLSENEDEFLPVINEIWPVVVKRLYDPEPYVSVAAADVVSTICERAGDFMSSRIESEWHELCNLYWEVHRKLQAEKRRSSSRGTYTPAYQTWDALVKVLVTIISFVRLEAEMEDDTFDMLGGYIDVRQDIREAITCLNPDAAWIETERQLQLRHGLEQATLPIMRGVVFREMVI